MEEIKTISEQDTSEEVGGEIGCILGCTTICVLTYMAGAAIQLSNKMDNSLLAVRGINHKYIVVENG